MASRDRLLSAYIEGLGACAVYVAGTVGDDRPVIVSSGADVASAVALLDGASPRGGILHFCRWLVDERAAFAALRGCVAAWRRQRLHVRANWFDVAAARATSDLMAAIFVTGAVAIEDQVMQIEAATAIERMDAELEQLRSTGQMRDVNRAYKAYRRAQAARGAPAAPYRIWFDEYRRALAREIGAQARTVDRRAS